MKEVTEAKRASNGKLWKDLTPAERTAEARRIGNEEMPGFRTLEYRLAKAERQRETTYARYVGGKVRRIAKLQEQLETSKKRYLDRLDAEIAELREKIANRGKLWPERSERVREILGLDSKPQPDLAARLDRLERELGLKS